MASIDQAVVDKADARVAATAAAFTCEDGRVIVHSFLSGSLGADWDLSGVLELIDEAESLQWVDHWMKHDLQVIITKDGRRLVYNFDVPAPEGVFA